MGPNFCRISLNRFFSIPGRQWLPLIAACVGEIAWTASKPAPQEMIDKVKKILRIIISVCLPKYSPCREGT
jgi:hypothetical protein